MTRLPRVTGSRLLEALRKAGFEVIRIKGSHFFNATLMGEVQWSLFTEEKYWDPGLLGKF